MLYNRTVARGEGRADDRTVSAEALLREALGETARAAARAPGRLELFAAHTDYNEGYVAARVFATTASDGATVLRGVEQR